MYGNKIYSVIILFVSLEIFMCAGYYHDTTFIKKKILENYNTDAVPVSDTNVSLAINVSLYIMALQGLDEKNQILTTSVFWHLTWRDDILKWNDTKYKDIKRMTLKVKDVWVPDLFIVNAVNDMHMSKPKDSDYVDVMFDGHIKWFPANHLITSCAVDLSAFPFDVQICSIKMESWYRDSNDFVLKSSVTGIKKSEYHFVENGEWEISNLSSCPYRFMDFDNASVYTGIEFFITLKRRPSYHLLTTVFPFLVLMFLNTLSIIIPTESGEKIGFCMSQFLTMIVFLTLVSQSMPVTSLTMSYFALLIGSQILISGISILFVATSIYIQCQSKNTSKQSKVLTKILAPSLYLRFFCRSRNEGNSQLKLRDFIKWEYLDQEINCILKGVLLINIAVSPTLYTILVWYS